MAERISVLAIVDGRPTLDPRRFEVEVAHDVGRAKQVILAATERRISARQATALRNFVRRGGGVVILGPTLDSWSVLESIYELTK